MTDSTTRPPDGPTLDEEIALLEGLILNAPSIEAARRYHERLDAIRPDEEAVKQESSEYRRGYQAGWMAGRRG